LAARKAPRSVHVASLALLLAASVQAGFALVVSASSNVGFAQWIFAAAVMAVLVWGIARGYRLAWLWGRYLTLFLSAMVLVSMGMGLWRREIPWTWAAALGLGLVIPLGVTSVALGRPGAIAWFDLVCPACQVPTNRGNDFLFRKARCRACGETW
jgi:hypothetical protein